MLAKSYNNARPASGVGAAVADGAGVDPNLADGSASGVGTASATILAIASASGSASGSGAAGGSVRDHERVVVVPGIELRRVIVEAMDRRVIVSENDREDDVDGEARQVVA